MYATWSSETLAVPQRSFPGILFFILEDWAISMALSLPICDPEMEWATQTSIAPYLNMVHLQKSEVFIIIVEIGWMTLKCSSQSCRQAMIFLSLPKKKPYTLQQFFSQLFSKVLIRRVHCLSLTFFKKVCFQGKKHDFFQVICTSNNWVCKILFVYLVENFLWIKRKLV